MKKNWDKMFRLCRYWFLRVLRVKSEPHTAALGLSLGVFIGCLPIIPFQSLAVLALACIFGGNKILALLGTLVSNPPTLPIFYYGLYWVGKFFVPGRVPKFAIGQFEFLELLHKGWDLVVVMMIGGVIVGIPAGLITYFFSLRVIRAYRKKREIRRLHKFMEER